MKPANYLVLMTVMAFFFKGSIKIELKMNMAQYDEKEKCNNMLILLHLLHH